MIFPPSCPTLDLLPMDWINTWPDCCSIYLLAKFSLRSRYLRSSSYSWQDQKSYLILSFFFQRLNEFNQQRKPLCGRKENKAWFKRVCNSQLLYFTLYVLQKQGRTYVLGMKWKTTTWLTETGSCHFDGLPCACCVVDEKPYGYCPFGNNL